MPLLNSEELDKIYNTYEPTNKLKYQRREKLILGLIIYQGLDRKSLLNIKVTDIDLSKGTISVPESGKRKNSRILKLESHQILPFQSYISKDREAINEKLFSTISESEIKLDEELKRINKNLKAQKKSHNIEIKRLTQLIQSRYGIWIKKHGIRKAQYLGGFKKALSMQEYSKRDIEDLQSGIEKYHPLQ
jgi:integrase/recombinase XerD